MTREAFVGMLEGYYGAYPRPPLKDAVLRYLKEYSEADLDVLMRELVLTYSGQYRHTPDVAVMEKAKEEVNSRSAIKRIGQKVPATTLIEDMGHLTSGEIVEEVAQMKRDMDELARRKTV